MRRLVKALLAWSMLAGTQLAAADAENLRLFERVCLVAFLLASASAGMVATCSVYFASSSAALVSYY